MLLTVEQLETFEKLKQEIIEFDDLVRGDREYNEELQEQLVLAEQKEFNEALAGSFEEYKEMCDVIVTLTIYLHRGGDIYKVISADDLEEYLPLDGLEACYGMLVEGGMEWMLPLVIESNKSKMCLELINLHTEDIKIFDNHCLKLMEDERYSEVYWEGVEDKENLGWCYIIWRDSTGKYLKGPEYKTTKELLLERLKENI